MSPSPSRTRSSVSRASGRAPRAGLIGSVLLHGGIIAATFFTWSHSLDIVDQSTPIVPVDLVTVGEKTNVAPMVQEQRQLQPNDDLPAPQLDSVTAPAPPEQEAEAAPPPLQAAQAKIAPPPVIQPKAKPQPDVKKDKFDINSIMALLDKRAPAAQSADAKVGARTVKGIGAQNAMTADLTSALQSMIMPCWSPPVGAPHPDQLVVSFELFLNPDGTVAQPPQLTADSASAVARDPYTRAAAEAARRAIVTCKPYKLPADRYAQWRDITLTFDPRQMMGQ